MNKYYVRLLPAALLVSATPAAEAMKRHE